MRKISAALALVIACLLPFAAAQAQDTFPGVLSAGQIVGNPATGQGVPAPFSGSANKCFGNNASSYLANIACASLTLTDQILSGGANVTPYSVAAGNVTVDCGLGPQQYILNAGNFTITAPANDGSCNLHVINASGSASAVGTVTLANFSLKSPQGASFANSVTQSGTVTITNASPAVITYTAHGLVANTKIYFTTTSALPTGLTAYQIYYVLGSTITTNTFEVSATPGGTAINTSSAGSGTQTATVPSEFLLNIERTLGDALATWVQVQ